MSGAADDLRAARALLEDPTAWTTGAFARRRVGTATSQASGDDVVCRCANGALIAIELPRARGSRGGGLHLSLAAQALGYETASRLNDAAETTHAHVLALYDLAIRMAEADAEAPS